MHGEVVFGQRSGAHECRWWQLHRWFGLGRLPHRFGLFCQARSSTTHYHKQDSASFALFSLTALPRACFGSHLGSRPPLVHFSSAETRPRRTFNVPRQEIPPFPPLCSVYILITETYPIAATAHSDGASCLKKSPTVAMAPQAGVNGVLPVSVLQKNAPAAAPRGPKAAQPRMKLVLRRLPPGLTKSEFETILGEEWKIGGGKIDYLRYEKGKISREYACCSSLTLYSFLTWKQSGEAFAPSTSLHSRQLAVPRSHTRRSRSTDFLS